jgi:hypothetical protein
MSILKEQFKIGKPVPVNFRLTYIKQDNFARKFKESSIILEQASYLRSGRTPKPKDINGEKPVVYFCNLYLVYQYCRRARVWGSDIHFHKLFEK